MGLSPSMEVFMVECARQCLISQSHKPGVKLDVLLNENSNVCELIWNEEAGQLFAGKNLDEERTTDFGAMALSLLIIGNATKYSFCITTRKRSGLDFWLYEQEPEGLDFLNSAGRLVTSGIRNTNGNGKESISRRIEAKEKQVKKILDTGLEQIVSVVDFSEPLIAFQSTTLKNIEFRFRTATVNLDEVNGELIEYLKKHPDKLYELDPRKFEFLVAELLRHKGFDVFITKQTKDGGRDIVVAFKAPSGKDMVGIVECKRNSKKRPVGVGVVQRFLYTIRLRDQANFGMIATTSYFSPNARVEQKNSKWQLDLHDFEDMKSWLNNYGQWSDSNGRVGLWLPDNPLE